MTNADLLALLREARRNLKDVEIRNEDTGKWEWENKDLRDRIDAALAESQDSAKPVVEWEANEFFGNQSADLPGERHVGIAKARRSKGWWWTAGGMAATEEEAKAKAVALAEHIE